MYGRYFGGGAALDTVAAAVEADKLRSGDVSTDDVAGGTVETLSDELAGESRGCVVRDSDDGTR